MQGEGPRGAAGGAGVPPSRGRWRGATGEKAPRPGRGWAPCSRALAQGTPGMWGTPEGQGGVGAATPGLGSSPFRPLLSLVRTGRPPVPTARPRQLCSGGGSGRMLGNKSEPETRGDRDAGRPRDGHKGDRFRHRRALRLIVCPAGPGRCGSQEGWGLEALPSGTSGPSPVRGLLDLGSPPEPPPGHTVARTPVQAHWGT